MELALEECARKKLDLPGLALANRLYREVRRLRQGWKGTHALLLALEQHGRNSCSLPLDEP